MRTWNLLVLPGDGVGPEVVDSAMAVLHWFCRQGGLALNVQTRLYGGACYDVHGRFIEEDTVALARDSDAILCGSEGGPRWDALDLPWSPTDRSALTRLRKDLDLYANIRPARSWASLAALSPLRESVVPGADIMVVRELTGGIYYGEPRGIATGTDGVVRGIDTQVYSVPEIERIAREGFRLARTRTRRLASVEKSNVMESGVLWRRVVTAIGGDEFPDIELRHLYADNALYQMVRSPGQFDVILADNLFGDLLSDCAAVIPGSLGLLPSASLGPVDAGGRRAALYEPVHGSAPDIAGRGIANPLGTILSLGMMFEYSFGRPDDAQLIVRATEALLAGDIRTPDLGGTASTTQLTTAFLGHLDRLTSSSAPAR